MPTSPLCVCGHAREAHEHYRRGTDCAICGAENCPRFRPQRRRTTALAGPVALAPTVRPLRTRDRATGLRLVTT